MCLQGDVNAVAAQSGTSVIIIQSWAPNEQRQSTETEIPLKWLYSGQRFICSVALMSDQSNRSCALLRSSLTADQD